MCFSMFGHVTEWLYTCYKTPHSPSSLSGVTIAQTRLLSIGEHQSLDINASFIVTFLCNLWKINISQCFIVKESNLILLLEPNMSVSLLGGKSIWALTSLVQTLNFFPLAGECFRTSGSPLPQVTIE